MLSDHGHITHSPFGGGGGQGHESIQIGRPFADERCTQAIWESLAPMHGARRIQGMAEEDSRAGIGVNARAVGRKETRRRRELKELRAEVDE